MKTFDCHFLFFFRVQTHGKDEEATIDNIDRMIDDKVVQGIEYNMHTGIGYDIEDIKEVENGWWELLLKFSGFYMIDAKDKQEAKEITNNILDDKLTSVYQLLEIEADKRSRFELKELTDFYVDDVEEFVGCLYI